MIPPDTMGLWGAGKFPRTTGRERPPTAPPEKWGRGACGRGVGLPPERGDGRGENERVGSPRQLRPLRRGGAVLAGAGWGFPPKGGREGGQPTKGK